MFRPPAADTRNGARDTKAMLARTRSAAVEEEVQRLDGTRRCKAIVNEKVTRSVQVTRPERIVESSRRGPVPPGCWQCGRGRRRAPQCRGMMRGLPSHPRREDVRGRVLCVQTVALQDLIFVARCLTGECRSRRALLVDAVEIRRLVVAAAPLLARHLRIRAERPRPAGRVRRNDPVRSGAGLDPLIDGSAHVETVWPRAPGAVLHA